MKNLLLILLTFLLNIATYGQGWDDGETGKVTTLDNVIIGATNSITIESNAPFGGKKPFASFRSYRNTAEEVHDFVTFRNSSSSGQSSVDAVTRRIGLLFKLSHEGTIGESNKMGGIILESGNSWANYPDFHFLTHNEKRLTIKSSGNVGIGTTSPSAKLEVDGNIISEEVKVQVVNPPDYVFSSDYSLRSLEETKAYITENQHLPEVPSAKEMEAKGIELGEMNMLLLRKIEELTLYQIELLETVKAQQKRIEKLEQGTK